MLLLSSAEVEFPVRCSSGRGWRLRGDAEPQPEQLTFTAQICLIRQVMSRLLKALDLTELQVAGISLAALGFFQPWGGVFLVVDPFALVKAREVLTRFAARRPVRTSADLARPLGL